MGILDYFTLPESHKTKNLLSKFPMGIPNFRGKEFPGTMPRIITVYMHFEEILKNTNKTT